MFIRKIRCGIRDALKKGLVYTHPEIINSDQGCQFTSNDWVDYLNEWGYFVTIAG